MESRNEYLKVQTPEQVGFQFPLAGIGSRAIALLWDFLLRYFFIFVFVVGSLIAFEVFDTFALIRDWFSELTTWWIAILILIYGILELGYFILFEALWNGQTPGKKIQKLRVIRTDGQPIGWPEAGIRNILRAVDLPGGIYPIGVIVMFLSAKGQRIGDYAAGTVVIMEQKADTPGIDTRKDVSPRAGLIDLQDYIAHMTEKQYRVVSTFLERRETMTPADRGQIARKLALGLMQRWGIRPKRDVSFELFLESAVRAYESSRRAI